MGTKGRRDKRGGSKEARTEGEKSYDSEEVTLTVIVWLLCSPEPWIFQWFSWQGYCPVAAAIEPNTSILKHYLFLIFFLNQIFSPWYLGRGVCRWESLKNYIVNALYSAIFCMCVHGCAPVHSCAEASGRCWVSSSLTFYLSTWDKLSLNLWLAN